MTNEELALKIKAGDNSLQEELWLQIKDYVTWQAKRYLLVRGNPHIELSLELEDFIQVGYFAMLAAVKAFTEESEYKFTTYMIRHLLLQFNELTGQCSGLSKKSAYAKKLIVRTASLEDVVGNKTWEDSDGLTIGETCPDPSAEQAFKDVEDRDYSERLRADLNTALRELPEKEAICIRRYYLENEAQTYIAQILNKSQDYVRTLIHSGLISLRRCTALSEYRERQLSRAYKGSIGSWKSTGSSIQEQIVMNIDEQEQRLKAFLESMEGPRIPANKG